MLSIMFIMFHLNEVVRSQESRFLSCSHRFVFSLWASVFSDFLRLSLSVCENRRSVISLTSLPGFCSSPRTTSCPLTVCKLVFVSYRPHVDVKKLSRNTKLVAEALARVVYNLTEKVLTAFLKRFKQMTIIETVMLMWPVCCSFYCKGSTWRPADFHWADGTSPVCPGKSSVASMIWIYKT